MGPWTVVTPDWDLRPTTTAGRAGGGAGKRLLIVPFWEWLWPLVLGKGLNAYIRRPMSRRPAAEEGGRLHRLKIDGGEALASEVAPPIFRDADFLRPPCPKRP